MTESTAAPDRGRPGESSPSATRERLFGPDFFRRLQRLKLASRRLVAGTQKGEHRSRKRGSGIEFADYRPYIEGDGLRFVDWGAYLRFDKLLVRQFEEDGDLPVYLLLDCSQSMTGKGPEGTLRKFDFSRRVLAAIAYLSLENLDRVILAGFAESVVHRCPALRGTNQIHRALQFLASLQTGLATNLEISLRDFFGQPRRPGLVVVVSDFLHDQGASPIHKLAGLKHDVLVVRVLDHQNRAPRLPRRTRVIDVETGDELLLEEQPDRAEVYAELVEEHADEIRTLCRRNSWAFIDADTDAHFDDLILALMRSGHLRR